MPIRSIRGAVTVITGASEGIGRAAAIEFARAGARVVLAARSASRLSAVEQEIASIAPEILAVPTDVTSDPQVSALMDSAVARFGGIDILICNAGVGLYGRIADLPHDSVRRALEVNLFGVLRCVQAALPVMIPRRSGLIQIVSSVLGRRAVPGYGGYCATKFAVCAIAESLRIELEGSGIGVQTIYPALTDTRFARNAIASAPRAPSARLPRTDPAVVARRMLRAARMGARDTVVTLPARAMVLLNGIAPSIVDAVIAQVMSEETLQSDPADRALPDRRQ